MSFKKCSTCKEQKSLNEFSRCLSKKDGLQTTCKNCHSIRSSTEEGRLRSYRSKLKTVYGLDYKEYLNMYDKQQGKCALCTKEKPLVVDHDHKTGEVRGLVCTKCNLGLGLLGEGLEIGIRYLKESNK